jgi:hypothetical protein
MAFQRQRFLALRHATAEVVKEFLPQRRKDAKFGELIDESFFRSF